MDMENKLQTAAETARDLFAELGLSELTVRDGDFELHLKKETSVAAPAPLPFPAAMPAAQAVPAVPAVPGAQAAPSGNPSALAGCREVKSPLVGILYLAPAPGAEPFVTVGGRVAKGDVLCIVEAMKMMNEITADCEGTVLDICAANEDLVEYGQVLFKIG